MTNLLWTGSIAMRSLNGQAADPVNAIGKLGHNSAIGPYLIRGDTVARSIRIISNDTCHASTISPSEPVRCVNNSGEVLVPITIVQYVMA